MRGHILSRYSQNPTLKVKQLVEEKEMRSVWGGKEAEGRESEPQDRYSVTVTHTNSKAHYL